MCFSMKFRRLLTYKMLHTSVLSLSGTYTRASYSNPPIRVTCLWRPPLLDRLGLNTFRTDNKSHLIHLLPLRRWDYQLASPGWSLKYW